MRRVAVLGLLFAAACVRGADVCVGKAFNQESQWVGKQKRFRAYINDLAGCSSLNVSKLYWKGSCTDRENNFGNSSPSCGSKTKVLDASGETCKRVFAEGGSDDFTTVTETGRNFDVGLICNPMTTSNARSQDVFVFIRTSCASIAKVAVTFDEDKTDSCPSNAGSYSTRNDRSSAYGDPEKEHRGIFEKISRAIFGVIIAIAVCLLLCCVGVAALVFLRKRRAAKANAATQPGAQMQPNYGGGGYSQGPQAGYGQQGGYGNQNYGGNTGYQKEAQYDGQKPAGYPGGATATGHPVQGQPPGYPSAV